MVAGVDDRMDRYHTRLECHRSVLVEGRLFIRETGGKTMTNEITITDDMKAVQRWENEGGQVSLNSLWTSLKSFTTEDNFRERQLIGAQKSPQHQLEFSRFNLTRPHLRIAQFRAENATGLLILCSA